MTPDELLNLPQEAHTAKYYREKSQEPPPSKTVTVFEFSSISPGANEPTPEERARALVAAGYRQISRQYKLVARLPPGMTGLEALATINPRLAQGLLDNANRIAGEQYLRTARDVDKITLNREEFRAFKRVTDPRWEETAAEKTAAETQAPEKDQTTEE